ncbi:MAG TPA: PTS sugar transporter subunit IIA [Desulfobacterales bacterium]|nr:PTS sugar transporter subunit IIA [Desulfobacterales bacterium]
MKILDVLQKEAVLPDLKSQNKKSVIEELAMPVARIAGINHQKILRVLMEREQIGSTGIGSGIGIPHGKIGDIESLLLGFGLSRKGVDFESIDSRPTHIFFLLIAPENARDLHLELLGRIARILKNEPFRERLLYATDRDQIVSIIKEEDEAF